MDIQKVVGQIADMGAQVINIDKAMADLAQKRAVIVGRLSAVQAALGKPLPAVPANEVKAKSSKAKPKAKPAKRKAPKAEKVTTKPAATVVSVPSAEPEEDDEEAEQIVVQVPVRPPPMPTKTPDKERPLSVRIREFCMAQTEPFSLERVKRAHPGEKGGYVSQIVIGLCGTREIVRLERGQYLRADLVMVKKAAPVKPQADDALKPEVKAAKGPTPPTPGTTNHRFCRWACERGRFTYTDACVGHEDLEPNHVGAMISHMSKNGLLRKIGRGVYEGVVLPPEAPVVAPAAAE